MGAYAQHLMAFPSNRVNLARSSQPSVHVQFCSLVELQANLQVATLRSRINLVLVAVGQDMDSISCICPLRRLQ